MVFMMIERKASFGDGFFDGRNVTVNGKPLEKDEHIIVRNIRYEKRAIDLHNWIIITTIQHLVCIKTDILNLSDKVKNVRTDMTEITESQGKKYDVFVSYDELTEKDFATAIHRALTRKGYKVYFFKYII